MKCKADHEEELGNKHKAQKVLSSKASGLKEQQPRSKSKSKSKDKDENADEDEDIIDLVSDEDGFVNNFIKMKGGSDITTFLIMDYKRKIHCLEQELRQANTTISDLKLNIIELKQDLKVQARVEAALAQQFAAPAPAPVPTPHL
ncbi:hypothetical protein RSOL_021180, partial [Rhizoctonia solani AG-3 Rhs1AP]